MRVLGIRHIHQEARRRYQIGNKALAIPESAFSNPMTLIPMVEINRWFESLEKVTGNADVILDINRDVDVGQVGMISHWLLSGSDLASTIRRVNYGFSSLQSGAFLSASLNGSLIKWAYRNPMVASECKVHDSVRMAMALMKILRAYLGQDFSPLRVQLSGSRKNTTKYEAYFGCEVAWNHPATEIWFHSELRLATKQQTRVQKGRLAMNFADLDELLNMPDPEDEVKVIYEIFNYSRHYGLPTVDNVSNLLGLSVQQFQRRLRHLGMNFTTVSGYVLSNIAVEMMRHGIEVADIAPRLGYQNIASFNRMFKKHRGLTPNQYVQRYYA
ncbi:AraC family transcriptional regulator [Vibrio sp. T11.5]|uniref:AraC family transcriptional regulator n=1 Tax=Vibrio sp. T11.5 TaxID=2998836 RepID=UPI0022CD429E|nr:AraC family transcriptional regulator [Vibrio sp. T11.5]MDA0120714.1 AraC family transcriptional regulator ligand-binding domain-containing protein [Vibrio sp. T11.5]